MYIVLKVLLVLHTTEQFIMTDRKFTQNCTEVTFSASVINLLVWWLCGEDRLSYIKSYYYKQSNNVCKSMFDTE